MPIINSSQTDPNKILPHTYPWAWQYYKDGVANNWTPEEISMQLDVEQWKAKGFLSAQERKLILWNLGFFSTAETLTANNLVLIYINVNNPDCRIYIGRQIFEEVIHTDTFVYCCDSLGLNPDEIYNMYQTIPSIKEKDAFVVELTKSVLNPRFRFNKELIVLEKLDKVIRELEKKIKKNPNDLKKKVELGKKRKNKKEALVRHQHNIKTFLHNLIGYYVIMEGIFFYAGFAMMLALKRTKRNGQNIMSGIGQQFEYIMRDESLHLAFGCDLINTIKQENFHVWTPEFQKEVVELIKKAVELEKKYAIEACPEGIVGINAKQFCIYVEYIADRRLERIGLPKIYQAKNPFPWMTQATDLNKEKNFFETRVTEYQTGGSLKWDEEE